MRRLPDLPEREPSAYGEAFRFLRTLWELNHALESASRTMKKHFGVTGPERLFVRVVGKQPGVTPRELAAILRVDRSSVTVLIKRLEARGLITRGANAVDRRSFHLYLTPTGRRVDALRSGTVEAVVRDALASSARSDVEITSNMLVHIARRLEARLGRGPAAVPRRGGRAGLGRGRRRPRRAR